MKLIPFHNFLKGMHTDDYRIPGTARWLFDFLPHRGFLRRRGPVKDDSTSMFKYVYSTNAYGVVPDLYYGRLKINHATLENTVQHAHIPGIGEIAAYGSDSVQYLPAGTWVDNAGSAVSIMYRLEGESEWSMPWTTSWAGWTGTENWETEYDKFPRRWIALPDGEALGIYGGAYQNGATVLRWGGAVSGVADDGSRGDYRIVTTAGSREVSFRSNVGAAAIPVPDIVTEGAYILFGRTWRRIMGVETNTAYLETPAQSTNAAPGVVFQIRDIAPLSVSSAHTNGSAKFRNVKLGTGFTLGRAEYANAPTCNAAAYHQGRLFFGGLVEGQYRADTQGTAMYRTYETRIRWSGLPDEGGGAEDGIFRGIMYFHDDAYVDLPGEGGRIRAMASFNDQLVILRDKAVQILVGAVSTNGYATGASVQTVSTTVGCTNVQTWDVCEHGVVFADDNGVHLWDGRQIRSLTRERIDEIWDELGSPAMVCVANNRLIVSFDTNHDQDTDGFPNLSYLFGKDAWFGFYTKSPISRVGAVSKSLETFWLAEDGRTTPLTELKCQNLGGHYDHLVGSASGSDDDALDTGSDDFPRPELVTQPIPLVEGIQNARVTGAVLSDAGFVPDSMTMSMSIHKGPAYQAGYGSRDTASEDAGSFTMIGPNKGEATYATRTSTFNATSTDEATHAYIQLKLTPTENTDPFDYRLIGVGLLVDDEGRFEV